MNESNTFPFNVDILKICINGLDAKYIILDNFSCIIVLYINSTFMGQSIPTAAFNELIQYFTNIIYIKLMHERGWCIKSIILQNDSYES